MASSTTPLVVGCMQVGQRYGRLVVAGGQDGIVRIYTLAKGEAVGRENENENYSLASTTSTLGDPMRELKGFLPGQGRGGVERVSLDIQEEHVGAVMDGLIKVWDLRNGQVVRTFNLYSEGESQVCKESSGCVGVQFHPVKDIIAVGNGEKIVLFDMRKRNIIHSYPGAFSCFKFSPCGKWIVAGCRDGSVKVLDIEMKRVLKDFKKILFPGQDKETTTDPSRISLLFFHPKEIRCIVGQESGRVSVIDLNTFKVIGSHCRIVDDNMEGSARENPVSAVAFAPNDAHILYSYHSGTRSLHQYTLLDKACSNIVMYTAEAEMSKFISGEVKKENVCLRGISEKMCVLSTLLGNMMTIDIVSYGSRSLQKPSRTSEASNAMKAAAENEEEESRRKNKILENEKRRAEEEKARKEKETKKVLEEKEKIEKEGRRLEQLREAEAKLKREREEKKQLGDGDENTQNVNVADQQSHVTPPHPSAVRALKKKSVTGTPNKAEQEVKYVETLTQQHEELCDILSTRLRTLGIVRRYWNKGGAGRVEALQYMHKAQDLSVISDVVRTIVIQSEDVSSVLSFDVLYPLLQNIKLIMFSENETENITALIALRVLLNECGAIVKSYMRPTPGAKEDKDERALRVECSKIHAAFLSLKKQFKAEGYLRDKKRSKVAREALEAYKCFI